ncbi:MAG: hypothetical protein RLZZ26_129 [Candidatus Parcubacteria bacterium]
MSTIIHVDYAARPPYMRWPAKPLQPKFVRFGPTDYDLAKLERQLHDGQRGGQQVVGHIIYNYLVDQHLLERCLGFQDGYAIQARGVDFFRQLFGRSTIPLWRAAVRNNNDRNCCVPVLNGSGGIRVKFHWADFGGAFGWDYPIMLRPA